MLKILEEDIYICRLVERSRSHCPWTRNLKLGKGAELQFYSFLISVQDWGEWPVSRPGGFTPGERTRSIHLIERWIGPRAGVDFLEKMRDENVKTGNKLSYFCMHICVTKMYKW